MIIIITMLREKIRNMANPRTAVGGGYRAEREPQEGGGSHKPSPDRDASHRWMERPMRVLVTAVAAGSALVGLTAACTDRESSPVAVNQAGAVAPASESGVLQAATSAGSSSPEIGGSTPSVSVPPEPEALLEQEPEAPPLPTPAIAPSAARSGGGVLTLLDPAPPEPWPQPQILHVEVDGDNAVIISGQAAQVSQRGEEGSGVPSPSKGEKFIWHNGDREASVWQDTRLVVGDVISGGWGDPYGPVFWSQSDNLMALPGGVVLFLDPTWNAASVEAFMRSNDIDSSDLKAFEGLINSFEVKTEPGFPSLRLANTLAGQGGVIVSSPNWWIAEAVR